MVAPICIFVFHHDACAGDSRYDYAGYAADTQDTPYAANTRVNIRRYATNTQDTKRDIRRIREDTLQMFTVRGRVFSYGLAGYRVTHFFWSCATNGEEIVKTVSPFLPVSWPRHHAKRRYENQITVVSVFHGRATMQNEDKWSPCFMAAPPCKTKV